MKRILLLAVLAISQLAFGQISGPGSITSYPAVVNTNSAATPNFSVTSPVFKHEMLPLANSILVVGCSKNTYIATAVTSVTVNGVPMQKADQRTGIPKPTDTSLWYLTGVPAGTAIIAVNSQGGATHGYGASCMAKDYYGVDANNPIEFIDTDVVPANAASVACTFNPQQDGDWVVIFEYSTAYNQSAPMSAAPFAPDIVTGRYYALQMAMAQAGPLSAGQQYTETWMQHNSTVSVEWTIVALTLRPAL